MTSGSTAGAAEFAAPGTMNTASNASITQTTTPTANLRNGCHGLSSSDFAPCKRCGMAAPALAVGDGVLGFWKAVPDVFPETREQRCWWHKIGNVLNCLPKSAQPGAKAALAEVYNAEAKTHAAAAAMRFATDYGTKWPKAAAKIADDLDVLWRSTTTQPSTGAPANQQPDRADLRDRPTPTTRYQRPRIPGGRGGDGVQADRVSPNPLEPGTHPTSSPSSAPERASATANSSNDPTKQEAIDKPPGHTHPQGLTSARCAVR